MVVAAGLAGCGREGDSIGKGALEKLPPIAVIAGDRQTASYTGAGNLYLLHPGIDRLEPVLVWPPATLKRGDDVEFGLDRALWSPDRAKIGLLLSTLAEGARPSTTPLPLSPRTATG